MKEVVHGRGCNSVSMMASATIFSVLGPIRVRREINSKRRYGRWKGRSERTVL